jgi:hypothetical protein
LAVAALVLGVLATLCPLLYSLSANLIVAAIPLGLVALLLAILARRAALRSSRPAGLATVAIATGLLPLLVSTAMLIFYARLTGEDKPFVARDAVEAQKLEQDRAHNAKEFDELVKKALPGPGKEEEDNHER